MKVRFNGGIKDVPLSEVTAANYIVPQREERFWHVLQEKVEFDRNTGKRMSQPMLQKYDTKAYPRTEKYLRDAGYTITVLHDPIAWAKANAQAKAKIDAQRAKANAEAKAAAAKADREALKDELRKEMQAEREAMKQELLKEIAAQQISEPSTPSKNEKKGSNKK